MFEKEAEEYAKQNNPAEYGVRATHFTVLNSYKDGAEFSYNKAKEYAKIIIQDLLDNSDEYARQRAMDFLEESNMTDADKKLYDKAEELFCQNCKLRTEQCLFAYRKVNGIEDCHKACVGCEHSEDGKQYRPYRDALEFIADYGKRFPTATPRPLGTMPLIWIAHKTDGTTRLIVEFSDRSVKIGCKVKPVDFGKLFEYWTYTDGSPCGKEC